MGFLRRAERLLARDRASHLDHGMLMAALATRRRTETVQAPDRAVEAVAEQAEEPLVELLLGGPDWRQALSAQRGCFSRAEAGRRVNDL